MGDRKESVKGPHPHCQEAMTHQIVESYTALTWEWSGLRSAHKSFVSECHAGLIDGAIRRRYRTPGSSTIKRGRAGLVSSF